MRVILPFVETTHLLNKWAKGIHTDHTSRRQISAVYEYGLDCGHGMRAPHERARNEFVDFGGKKNARVKNNTIFFLLIWQT